MTRITSRELRNRTADVLRQVAGGRDVTITVNGSPVADLTAHRSGRRAALTRSELMGIVGHQANAALRDELLELEGDETDDLGPLI